MPFRSSRLVALLAVTSITVVGAVEFPSRADDQKAESKFTPQQVAHFEKEVLPVLTKHCLKCHGAEEKVKGELYLTSRKTILEGGSTGPAVDLKNPAESLILKAIHYKDEHYQMPPKGKLADRDIAIIEKWVKDGLPVSADRLGGEIAKKSGFITEEAKKYWAYQPVRRSAAPEVRDRGWVKTPIDAFILAKLDAKNLRPVKPADRGALARRAYYNLTGLPPTPEVIDAFVADRSADAWEKLIDKLLASPHYGEKWGRHWLDVVRYAETNGYERDGIKPYAWRYRDYVIRSFNEDKPYTQFIREQLAGDEIPGYHPEAVIATGFYRLGTWDDETGRAAPGDLRRLRRPGRDHRAGVPRNHLQLRPLPRPQGRPDSADRLLQARGLLSRHTAVLRHPRSALEV